MLVAAIIMPERTITLVFASHAILAKSIILTQAQVLASHALKYFNLIHILITIAMHVKLVKVMKYLMDKLANVTNVRLINTSPLIIMVVLIVL